MTIGDVTRRGFMGIGALAILAPNELSAESINKSLYYDGRPTIENDGLWRPIEAPLIVRGQEKPYLKWDMGATLDAAMGVLSRYEGADEPFSNAAKKTIEGILFYSDIYNGRGKDVAFIEPVFIALMSEVISDDVKVIEYDLLYTPERWLNLKRGVDNYGFTLSANLYDSNQKLDMTWKQVCISKFPKEGKLITEGNFRGFIVLDNGDLFVPGKKFYEGVKNESIDVSNYKRIKLHYRNEMKNIKDAFLRGNQDKAIVIIDDLLRNDSMRKPVRAQLYYTLGSAYEKKAKVKDGWDREDLNTSLNHYNNARTAWPRYFEASEAMGKLFALMGRFDDSLKYYNDALKHAKGKDAERIKSVMEMLRDYLKSDLNEI